MGTLVLGYRLCRDSMPGEHERAWARYLTREMGYVHGSWEGKEKLVASHHVTSDPASWPLGH